MSYLYYFNIAQDYYECHEYGEHLWLEEGRPVILKGLIQAAVCLYHLHNGNVKGGWMMWQRAKAYMAPERPVYQNIDLDSLTRDIDAVFALVPEAWRSLIVPPRNIDDLQLPTVLVQLTDQRVLTALSTWTPLPLDHED